MLVIQNTIIFSVTWTEKILQLEEVPGFINSSIENNKNAYIKQLAIDRHTPYICMHI